MAQSTCNPSAAPCLWWSANSCCWACLLSWILSLVAPFFPFLFPSPATAEVPSLPALLFSLFNTNQSSFCSLLLYNFSWERVSKHPLAPAGARTNRAKERFHSSLAWWMNEIIDLVYTSTRESFLQEPTRLQDWNVPPHHGQWRHRISMMEPCLQLTLHLSYAFVSSPSSPHVIQTHRDRSRVHRGCTDSSQIGSQCQQERVDMGSHA